MPPRDFLTHLSDSPAAGKVRSLFRIKSAVSAGLNEKRREELPLEDPHSLGLAIGPKKSLTLRLELESTVKCHPETPQPVAPIELQDFFPDGLASNELPTISNAEEIKSENRRADRLESELAEKAARLADSMAKDERELDPVQLHERYRLNYTSHSEIIVINIKFKASGSPRHTRRRLQRSG